MMRSMRPLSEAEGTDCTLHPSIGSLTHPAAASQLSLVHGSLSSQSTAGPTSHAPLEHTEAVHASPLLHAPPSLLGTDSHKFEASLQIPALQSSALAEQSWETPQVGDHSQMPKAEQLSPVVQKAPSSQALPTLIGWASQLSDDSLHTPALH